MAVKSKEPARNAKDKQISNASISLPPGLNGSIIMKLQEMGKWQEVRADLLKNPKSSAWERMFPSTEVEPLVAENEEAAPEPKTSKPRAKPATLEKPERKPREISVAPPKKELAPPPDAFKDWLSTHKQESFLDLHQETMRQAYRDGNLSPVLSEKYRLPPDKIDSCQPRFSLLSRICHLSAFPSIP